MTSVKLLKLSQILISVGPPQTVLVVVVSVIVVFVVVRVVLVTVVVVVSNIFVTMHVPGGVYGGHGDELDEEGGVEDDGG